MVITDEMKSQSNFDLFLDFANKRVDRVTFEDYQRYVNWLEQTSPDKERHFTVFWFIAYLTGKTPGEAAKDYFQGSNGEKLKNRFNK